MQVSPELTPQINGFPVMLLEKKTQQMEVQVSAFVAWSHIDCTGEKFSLHAKVKKFQGIVSAAYSRAAPGDRLLGNGPLRLLNEISLYNTTGKCMQSQMLLLLKQCEVNKRCEKW